MAKERFKQIPVDQTALRQRPAMTALTLTKSSGKSDEKTPISPFSPSAYSYSSRNPASPGLTAESPFSPGQPKSPASQQSSVNSSADFNQSLQQTSPVKAAAPPTRPSLSASQAPRRNYSTTESENSDTRPSTANTSPRALSSNYTPLTSLTMKEGWILEEFVDERYNRLRKALFQVLTQEIDYPLLVPYELAAFQIHR